MSHADALREREIGTKKRCKKAKLVKEKVERRAAKGTFVSVMCLQPAKHVGT